VRVAESDGVEVVRYFNLTVDPAGSPPAAIPETGAGTRTLEVAAISLILVGVVLISVATLARSKRCRDRGDERL
jgi:hypothetical protein